MKDIQAVYVGEDQDIPNDEDDKLNQIKPKLMDAMRPVINQEAEKDKTSLKIIQRYENKVHFVLNILISIKMGDILISYYILNHIISINLLLAYNSSIFTNILPFCSYYHEISKAVQQFTRQADIAASFRKVPRFFTNPIFPQLS